MNGLSEKKPKLAPIEVSSNNSDGTSGFQRPNNIEKFNDDNKVVGYIDLRCEDNTEANIFVTHSDLSVIKTYQDKTKNN